MLAALDAERPVAVCRELTKAHEEVVRGSAAELAARYRVQGPRGEVALVVGPAPETEGELGPALDALERVMSCVEKQGWDAEVLVVDDGSSDGVSWAC